MPPSPELQRYGAVLFWLGAASGLAAAFLPTLGAGYRPGLAVLSAAAAAVLGLGLWLMPVRRRSPWVYLPFSIGALACILGGIVATGGYASPLTVMVFTVGAYCAVFFPIPISVGIALVGAGVLAVPLLQSNEPDYLRQVMVWAPMLVATTSFVALSCEMLRGLAKENRYLETLARSTEILVKQDLQETLEITVKQVLAATGADSCVLFLFDEERQVLRPRVIHLAEEHYSREELSLWEKIEVDLGKGMTGWAALHRQAILSGDSERDPRSIHVPGTEIEDASAIVAPMVVGDRVVGVIRASRKGLHMFSQEDLNLLQVLAGQAAVAVDQARLYQETAELAMTDPLTGLFNRHYFNQVLEPQLKVSQGNRPVGVLMIDIYDFKRINDSFGHLAGDELLQTVGNVLRQTVRTTDIIVRYGGDEFVVVMPGSGLVEATQVMNRIEQAVQHWNAFERKSALPPLTLNIGVDAAVATNLEELLARADVGMYQSKRTEDRERLNQLLEASAHEREKHAVQSVLALAKILELKDPYTRGHSERARRTAMRVARKLNLPEEEVQEIGFGAVLHDVGKIVIPTEILNKPGSLNEDETRLIRRHPEYGANILGELELLSRVRPIVLHHQERWDGSTRGSRPGYPAGLKLDEIPIGSRIIAVVDAYDAMTSNRSYRKAMSREDAVAELKRNSGTQFDPTVVDVFLDVLEEVGTASSVTD
jgi:diguanylate cyclase (GGDEF)-like protein